MGIQIVLKAFWETGFEPDRISTAIKTFWSQTLDISAT